ncbi:MAG TPA: hypothetical protein VNE84_02835 [Candidatus Limnocylindria bacterium]|jgi:hypothetical protein|nr:hypothetical protein [Candidatus Limnocylindria bacterium]
MDRVSTKTPAAGQVPVISNSIIKRYFGGYGDQHAPDEHGMLPRRTGEHTPRVLV